MVVLEALDGIVCAIYGLGFFGMKMLSLSFLSLGRLRGGGFDFCSLVDEDASSTCGLFGSGCRRE